MNTDILIGPPDRHKEPLCLCKSSDYSRCSQCVLRSTSASDLPCNDGLNTRAAPYPLYEGKNQDGNCRFGPVRSTATMDNSTTLSSEFHHGYATRIGFDFSSEETGTINVHCRQQVRVIVFMHYVRIIIPLQCPRMTFYYVISANVVNGKYTRLHTLVSYVLLLALSTGTYGLQHGNCVVRHISFQWQMRIIDLS